MFRLGAMCALSHVSNTEHNKVLNELDFSLDIIRRRQEFATNSRFWSDLRFSQICCLPGTSKSRVNNSLFCEDHHYFCIWIENIAGPPLGGDAGYSSKCRDQGHASLQYASACIYYNNDKLVSMSGITLFWIEIILANLRQKGLMSDWPYWQLGLKLLITFLLQLLCLRITQKKRSWLSIDMHWD